MRLGLACLTACLLSTPALAQDGMRQLGAHVHGSAQLAIAADSDGAVLAELTTPAFNLFVFEHAPQTPEEHAVVSEAAQTLSSDAMIVFSRNAGCTLDETRISNGPDADGAHEHDHDHDGEDHVHAEGEAQDHDHNHDHDGAEGHANIVVSWTFECARPARLTEVDISGLFTAFPQFETLEVQYFDGARAAAQDLTPARPTLSLN